ncbi:MAG: hypothetical protein O2971_04290 [Proteobacteria bacterium]|nr:hypothetical protein [Pseudomonadota bacterium]
MIHIRLALSRKLVGAVALIFLGLTSEVLAAENPWFVEVAFVASELDDPIDRNLSSVFDTGITPVFVNSNGFESDDAAGLGVGYYFSPDWGVRLTWSEIDNFETLTLIDIPQFPREILNNQEINIDGFNIGVFTELKIANRWSLRGEVGVFVYNHKLNTISGRSAVAQGVLVSVPNATYNPNDNLHGGVRAEQVDTFYLPASFATPIQNEANRGAALSVSLGTVYRLTEKIGLTLDYQFIDNIEDSRFKGLRLGIRLRL